MTDRLTFYETIIVDDLVFPVIPAQPKFQLFQHVLDSRLRGNDGIGDFSKSKFIPCYFKVLIYDTITIDGVVKTLSSRYLVIPAQEGIQFLQ